MTKGDNLFDLILIDMEEKNINFENYKPTLKDRYPQIPVKAYEYIKIASKYIPIEWEEVEITNLGNIARNINHDPSTLF